MPTHEMPRNFLRGILVYRCMKNFISQALNYLIHRTCLLPYCRGSIREDRRGYTCICWKLMRRERRDILPSWAVWRSLRSELGRKVELGDKIDAKLTAPLYLITNSLSSPSPVFDSDFRMRCVFNAVSDVKNYRKDITVIRRQNCFRWSSDMQQWRFWN